MVVVHQPPSPAQYDMHNELMKETRKFIKAYDSIVLHQEPYRSLFLLTLNYLRENLVRLIQKFGTLSKDGSKVKSVECCGVFYDTYDDLKEHYEQSHYRKALQSASLCELKMSLTKISLFERTIRGYLKGGEVSSCEMIMNLKRILRKVDTTLGF